MCSIQMGSSQKRERARMTNSAGWEDFKRGVKPLQPERARPAAPQAAARPAQGPAVNKGAPARFLTGTAATGTKKPSVALRLQPALTAIDDPQLLRRLEQGKTAIDASLDLHHHTESAAHQAVLDFLTRAKQKRWRILRIITGCGSVLRPALPRWLAASQARPVIRWIAPASARHGGDGAFYLVLQRDKSHHK